MSGYTEVGITAQCNLWN